MKIAVTYQNGQIFQHFGHTAQFKLYEVEDGKIVYSEVVDTMDSGHGALAGMLMMNGVDDLICGADLSGSEAAPASLVDLSCMKVMLTGVMLVVVAAFLIAADQSNMEFAALCFFLGIGVFLVGLLIPWDPKEKVIIDDTLPQRKCPKCGKEHDFDYHKCPYCGFDYLRQKGSSHE